MHYIYITTINTDKWRARNEPNYQKELFWHFFVASFRALLLISKGINLTFIIFIFENCQFRRRTIMNAFIRAIRNINSRQSKKKWKKKNGKKCLNRSIIMIVRLNYSSSSSAKNSWCPIGSIDDIFSISSHHSLFLRFRVAHQFIRLPLISIFFGNNKHFVRPLLERYKRRVKKKRVEWIIFVIREFHGQYIVLFTLFNVTQWCFHYCVSSWYADEIWTFFCFVWY